MKEAPYIQVTPYELATRFIGLKEYPGAVANPQILAMLNLEGSLAVDDSTPWCFSGDIEILTKDGFIRFDELSDDIEVAQVGAGCEITFVKPIKLIKKNYCGEIITAQGRNFNLVCDINHRFFGFWEKGKKDKTWWLLTR